MSVTTPGSQVIACTPAWTDESHPDWYGIAARFLAAMSSASGRTDLIVKVSPDVEHLYEPQKSRRPIASFVPSLAEVRLTANRVWNPTLDDPARIDPRDAGDRARYPAMMGVMTHEAAHAAHTRLVFPKGTPRAVTRWATVLEEPRIEAQQVRRRPQDRQWLRASAVQLCADGALTLARGDEDTNPGVSRAIRSAVLFLGRVEAGVLTAKECEALRTEIVAVLGVEAMGVVDAVLAEAVRLEDGDVDGLCRLAADLAALTEDEQGGDGQDQGEGQDGDGEGQDGGGQDGEGQDGEGQDGEGQDGGVQGSGSGEGQDGEGQGSGSGEGQDGDGQDQGEGQGSGSGEGQDGEGQGSGSGGDGHGQGEAQQLPCGSWTGGDVPEGADPWEAPEVDDSVGDTPRMTEAIRETAEQVAEEAQGAARAAQFPVVARRDPREVRREEKDREIVAAAVAACGSDAVSITVAQRTPRPDLHAAARRMTSDLRRAQFRDITRTRIPSVTPPGRMRMGEMMRRQSQRDAHVRLTAQPFKQTRRRVAENPPLTVGFSGDVSGSMGAWQAATADIAWVLAQAVTHLSGTIAATAWNQQAAFTMKPGSAPAKVQEAACGGGSGGCAVSLDALDGSLGLSRSSGARMVVVVTDGHISGGPAIQASVDRLTRAGVTVLWISTKATGWSPKGVHRADVSDPREVAQVVGQAVIDALRAA